MQLLSYPCSAFDSPGLDETKSAELYSYYENFQLIYLVLNSKDVTVLIVLHPVVDLEDNSIVSAT